MSERLTSPFDSYRAPSIHDVLDVQAVPDYEGEALSEEAEAELREKYAGIAAEVKQDLLTDNRLLTLVDSDGTYTYTHERDSIPFATVFDTKDAEFDFVQKAVTQGLLHATEEIASDKKISCAVRTLRAIPNSEDPVYYRSFIIAFEMNKIDPSAPH